MVFLFFVGEGVQSFINVTFSYLFEPHSTTSHREKNKFGRFETLILRYIIHSNLPYVVR